ncbi:MAG: DUF1361 domain-containing protein [Caldilineae bacterium]|nr:MAG: DUF1361 domain-containing protein [Caldilineae bacterium]
MRTLMNQLRPLHHFLARHGLYAVSVSTLLAVSLLAGRMAYSRSVMFGFLLWNLILAWLPYFFGLWAAHLHQRYPRRWWAILLPGGLWLVFFPNAPYILTDFLHLASRAPIPLWYDTGLLASFAWTGLFLGIYSLRAMQTLVADYLGRAASWLFVLTVVGLSGLGIYLGRFLRWNSWDLLFHPRQIFADVALRLTDPLAHPGAVGVTVLFSAFLLVCYLTLTAVPSPESLRG